jgi:hypothetical protein
MVNDKLKNEPVFEITVLEWLEAAFNGACVLIRDGLCRLRNCSCISHRVLEFHSLELICDHL